MTAELEALAFTVEALRQTSNATDVLVEIALFEPCDAFKAIRANDAGTKVIYTLANGKEATAWAYDWTFDAPARANTASLLRASTPTQNHKGQHDE